MTLASSRFARTLFLYACLTGKGALGNLQCLESSDSALSHEIDTSGDAALQLLQKGANALKVKSKDSTGKMNSALSLGVVALVACIFWIAMYWWNAADGKESVPLLGEGNTVANISVQSNLECAAPFFNIVSLILIIYSAYAGLLAVQCQYGPLGAFLLVKVALFVVIWAIEIIVVHIYEVSKEMKTEIDWHLSWTVDGEWVNCGTRDAGYDLDKGVSQNLKRLLQVQQLLFLVSIIFTAMCLWICIEAVGWGGFLSTIVSVPMAGTPCGANAINAMSYFLVIWLGYVIGMIGGTSSKTEAFDVFLKAAHLNAL